MRGQRAPCFSVAMVARAAGGDGDGAGNTFLLALEYQRVRMPAFWVMMCPHPRPDDGTVRTCTFEIEYVKNKIVASGGTKMEMLLDVW